MLVRWLVNGVLVFVAACAGAAPGTEPSESGDLAPDALQASVPANSAPNVLTAEDLRRTDVGNVYDALRRLRPQWLRARGSASLVAPRGTEPIVYVSGIRRGELRTLQNVNIETVSRVEFVDARDATTRFGTGHAGGVIWVELTRGN
jgi:outer membrane receptor for ferrienterochelin and colicin